MKNKAFYSMKLKGGTKKVRKYNTKHNRGVNSKRYINLNTQNTEYDFAKAVQTLESLHPNAMRINENTWLLPRETWIRVVRKKQLERAFNMQLNSVDTGNSNIAGHIHYRMHPMHSKGLMPPGFGGYYVCSKNSTHIIYVLGPLYDYRCRVRGCRGKLKPI